MRSGTLIRQVSSDLYSSDDKRRVNATAILFAGLIASIMLSAAVACAQPADRESQLAERYLTILKRNPREGTAFDRVFEFHESGGTLEKLVAQLTIAANSDSTDGSDWMIVGMCELRRGNHERAATAFSKAEAQRPDDPIVAWYLGRSHFAAGDYSSAARSLEAALDSKPSRLDLQSIAQLLATAHQRLNQPSQAIAVYDRLGKEFPEDQEIKERIATLLKDQGLFADALQRFDQLASTAKSPSDQSQYAIHAAEVELLMGNQASAVRRFEAVLTNLKPSGWRYRDHPSTYRRLVPGRSGYRGTDSIL